MDVDATVRTGSSCFKLQCSLTRKFSLELWIFARAACGCFPRNPDACKELEAIAAVQRLLLSLRSQWQTSLDDDEKIMKNEMHAPTMPLRNRFALFYRIGRKRIVRKMETAMAYLASCLNNGFHSCSAADRDIVDSAACDGDSQILEALGQHLKDQHQDAAVSRQLYSCALHALRKSRRSGVPEAGLSLPTTITTASCGQTLNKVTFVACGQNMSACVHDGVLFTTGSSDFGKLGHSTTEFDMPHQEVLFRAVPQLKQVVVVACGGNHSVCIDTLARVFSWGENVYGQCGLGFTCQQVTYPCAVVIDQQFDSVVCGESVTLFSNSNQVYACGCNLEGECGLGSRDAAVEIPTRVQLPDQFDGIRKVCCRWRHSVALMNDGHVFVWGSADDSRIGVPATHGSIMAKSLSAAEESTASFGKNAHNSRDSCVNLPLLLDSCGTQLPAIVDAAVGFKMSVFVTHDGAVYACGAVGLDESVMPLHHVAALPPCKRIWSGSSHGFLLTNDDALLAFGKTSCGRLGCISASDVKFVPISEANSMVVDLPGASNVTMISCGQAQSLIVLGGGNADVSRACDAKISLVAFGRFECVVDVHRFTTFDPIAGMENLAS